MNFNELLKSLELSEEQITAIEAGMTDNYIFLTGEQDVETRLAKMKEQRDLARSEVKEQSEKVAELTTQNEELNKTITENTEALDGLETLKADLESVNGAKNKLERGYKLEKLLREAGATDTEYMAYKLGGADSLEVDDDGNFTGLDDRLKELQTKHPKYFKADEPAQITEPGKGYKVADTGLQNGNSKETSDPFAEKVAKYKD